MRTVVLAGSQRPVEICKMFFPSRSSMENGFAVCPACGFSTDHRDAFAGVRQSIACDFTFAALTTLGGTATPAPNGVRVSAEAVRQKPRHKMGATILNMMKNG